MFLRIIVITHVRPLNSRGQEAADPPRPEAILDIAETDTTAESSATPTPDSPVENAEGGLTTKSPLTDVKAALLDDAVDTSAPGGGKGASELEVTETDAVVTEVLPTDAFSHSVPETFAEPEEVPVDEVCRSGLGKACD